MKVTIYLCFIYIFCQEYFKILFLSYKRNSNLQVTLKHSNEKILKLTSLFNIWDIFSHLT